MSNRRRGRDRQFHDAGYPSNQYQDNNQPDLDHPTLRTIHHVHAHIEPQHPMAISAHDGGPHYARHGPFLPNLHQ